MGVVHCLFRKRSRLTETYAQYALDEMSTSGGNCAKGLRFRDGEILKGKTDGTRKRHGPRMANRDDGGVRSTRVEDRTVLSERRLLLLGKSVKHQKSNVIETGTD